MSKYVNVSLSSPVSISSWHLPPTESNSNRDSRKDQGMNVAEVTFLRYRAGRRRVVRAGSYTCSSLLGTLPGVSDCVALMPTVPSQILRYQSIRIKEKNCSFLTFSHCRKKLMPRPAFMSRFAEIGTLFKWILLNSYDFKSL